MIESIVFNLLLSLATFLIQGDRVIDECSLEYPIITFEVCWLVLRSVDCMRFSDDDEATYDRDDDDDDADDDNDDEEADDGSDDG